MDELLSYSHFESTPTFPVSALGSSETFYGEARG